MHTLLIQDPRSLAELCGRLAAAPWVALDTEFVRESTYYAKLGLLQIALDEHVACVDPLAVDLTPLLDALYAPKVLKVMHAARQDVEVLYDLRRDTPRPLFDTQIAAALLGHTAQIGYGNLVEAVTGVKLPKLHTRTNWEARPLTAEQLRYAADDVIYLRDVYRRLDAELRARGRLAWLEEECTALADSALYRNDPELAYQRFGPGHALAAAAQPVLKALAAWRERTAQTRNRPRTWIASDAALIEIARASPTTREALARVREVTTGLVQTHGDDIVSVVRAAGAEPPQVFWNEPTPPTAAEQNLMRKLLARVNEVARANAISAEVLATRRSLSALIRDRAGPLARGWRYELIGRELVAMLNDGKG
ncbi:MAG: ribonuclease D [Sulfurifustaceae bacterium]